VVADDVHQAAEDLRRDRSTQRTPTLAIDTGLPEPAQLTQEVVAGLAEDERARGSVYLPARTELMVSYALLGPFGLTNRTPVRPMSVA
jgi:hypothetical protein